MNIAVIGAGAAGLCAARHSVAAGNRVTVFEQTDVIGGTWVYTDKAGKDAYGIDIHSAMYQGLMSNIPKEIMGYPDFDFPVQNRSYIPAADVLAYIELYAEKFSLRKLIRHHTQVIRVRPINNSKWEIIVKDLKEDRYETQTYDAVMVCNGHYSVPLIPEYAGRELFEGRQMHSHEYRCPDSFKDRTVLVIGSGPSGLDISCAVAEVASSVTMSYHNVDGIKKFPDHVQVKPDIQRFTETGAEFVDGSEKKFDDVIFCTGYRHCFPFLSMDCGITVDDNFIQPLYMHFININYPTMFIIGLPYLVCQLPTMDMQVRCAMSLLSGRAEMPSREQMNRETDEEMQRRWDSGFKRRHAHYVSSKFQEQFYADLARIGNLERIRPIIKTMYIASHATRSKDPERFRNEVFRVIDDETFESFFLA